MMIRKKVLIKSKAPSESESESGAGKVYHTKKPVKKPSKAGGTSKAGVNPRATISKAGGTSIASTFIVNNIVKLALSLKDINSIEENISKAGGTSKEIPRSQGLLKDVMNPVVPPRPWNSGLESMQGAQIVSAAGVTVGGPVVPAKTSSPFKSLIKRTGVKIKDPSKPRPTRKDLIINPGIKRQSKPIMSIYTGDWPKHSSYACWYCCHKFNTTPVGIPHLLIETVFHCYGNFCSYNCAKKYLNPRNEDDISMLQTSCDVVLEDDKSEKLQLLELMCHIELRTELDDCIKPACSRLSLLAFGGTLTIEEFRENFKTHDSYHVFKSPLVPISYQMEECRDKVERKKQRKNVSLDTLKIERAFSELEKCSTRKKTAIQKMLRQ